MATRDVLDTARLPSADVVDAVLDDGRGAVEALAPYPRDATTSGDAGTSA